MNTEAKITIITGATSGIGREAALQIARMNSCLVLPVRDLEKGKQVKSEIINASGNPSVYPFECDLASFRSINDFVVEFKARFSRLDLLINNAGIWENKRKETSDGIEMNFGVNHLAPFLLTNLLLQELKAGSHSRVINVSSEAHRYARINFDDPERKKNFNGFFSYSQSKLANILFTVYLAQMLGKEGISVNCLHPGVVSTNLFRNMKPLLRSVAGYFMITPRQGAETLVFLASSPSMNGETGGYYVRKKMRKPSKAARDSSGARRLWELSRQYTGI